MAQHLETTPGSTAVIDPAVEQLMHGPQQAVASEMAEAEAQMSVSDVMGQVAGAYDAASANVDDYNGTAYAIVTDPRVHEARNNILVSGEDETPSYMDALTGERLERGSVEKFLAETDPKSFILDETARSEAMAAGAASAVELSDALVRYSTDPQAEAGEGRHSLDAREDVVPSVNQTSEAVNAKREDEEFQELEEEYVPDKLRVLDYANMAHNQIMGMGIDALARLRGSRFMANMEQRLGTRRGRIAAMAGVVVLAGAAIVASKALGHEGGGHTSEALASTPAPGSNAHSLNEVVPAAYSHDVKPHGGAGDALHHLTGAKEAVPKPSVSHVELLGEHGAKSTVSEMTMDTYKHLGLKMPEGHSRAVINELSKRVSEYNGFTGREAHLPVGQAVGYPSPDVLEQWLAEAAKNAS